MSGAAPSSATVPVIAVDGPGGSGKGSVTQMLARRLDFHLLDSGALYRALALLAGREGAGDRPAVAARIAAALEVDFVPGPPGEPVGVRLEGTDVGQALRSEDCARAASALAGDPAVRSALLERQRAFRRPPGLVADGRDMGTVVFPDAALKIFLTASAEERARRRYKQLIAKGIDANLRALLGDMRARDRRDSERAVAPLRAAHDAVGVDTTGLDLEAVFARVNQLVRERLGSG